MSTNWTPDQKKVIDLRNRNLLVSAAAGSGKTAVLIERILSLISDPVRPVDIDELLVVTFTRAAAGEMRERLNAAIEKKLSEGEEDEHLTRQLTLIQSAQITTIDSFCSYILKNYFHVIGLDPNYRVMDEGEGKLLRTQVVQELLESRFEVESPEFRHFVECVATGKNDQILEDSILRLYEFSMSHPYPEKWLQECLAVYSAATMEEFEQSSWLESWLLSARERIEDLEALLETALVICGEPGGPYIYEPAIVSDLENFQKLKGAASYRELYTAIHSMEKWARLSSKKDETIRENKKNQVKAIREEVKTEIKALQEEYFAETPETEFKDMQAAGRPMKVLVELTLAFIKAFTEEKRVRNLCDFHDMEHLALSILVDEEGKPTDTAKELSGRFREIMIDEYQDSNLVQEAILTAVSRVHEGIRNIFMVGDVKQSIYRFRLARPELFLEKYEAYTMDDSDCQRIDLKQNFRSRREILAFTNEIFREIMRENPGKILYTAETALYPGAVYPETEPLAQRPELLLLDLDEEESLVEQLRMTPGELEAEMTGQRILRMVGKEEIFDKTTGGMRKVEFKDIVILFRSPAAFAESYGKVLESMGIPVYVGTRSGYFSAREVQVVLSLLKIIDNSSQDIPLAAVLLSSIGGFSKKETALIKSSAGEEKTFHESCRWYLENGEDEKLCKKLQDFYAMLEDFRQQAAFTPIHELLWYLFDVTGYAEEAAAMPAGEQRAQNLNMLVQKAWDYEKTSYRGLFNFIRYIENLQKYDVDYGEARSLGENRNVVQIMSIHRSKGLEFPVVFLGGLEKQFNRMDTRSRMVLDADLGIGFDMVDPVLRIRRTTLFKRCIQAKLNDDNLGEEIRVLYVALTRAREKLILTGAVSGLEKKVERWCQSAFPQKYGLSYQNLSGAGGYLDFLMPVLFKYESAEAFLTKLGYERVFRKEEDPVWSTPFSLQRVTVQELLAGGVTQEAEKALDLQWLNLLRPDEIYEPVFHEILEKRMKEEKNGPRIPVKLTVSQLKRQSETELQEESAVLYENGPEEEKDWEAWENVFEEPLLKEAAADEEKDWSADWLVPAENARKMNKSQESTEIAEEVLPDVDEIIPEFLKEKAPVRGAARGTAYHIFLQYLDFNRAESLAEVREQLRELKAKGRLTEEEATCIDCRRIRKLAGETLGKRMAKAQREGCLFREQHFIYAIPADRVYPEAEKERTLLIQGVVDAYFEEADGLILVDYKTDRVEKGAEEELLQKYAPQLNYYTEALEQLTGRKVKEKILYSLHLQKELS